MASTYRQFLAAPSSSLLADTASLHYVTTTTSFSGPTQIIKHLNSLQKLVAKKKEDILNVIDGRNVVAFEVETGLGFQTGGGPYLPGLDDNFLSGRLVHLPVMHIVAFDEEGKIAQIRLTWDQASLLKQMDIIGKSGRNWPITDSQDQIVLIQNCLKSSGFSAPVAPDHNETVTKTRGASTNAMRDPHASLQLFGSREDIEGHELPSVVSPYGGSRPHQRSFTDIIGDEPIDAGSPSANRHRNSSPSKGGQGKNFQPMRIFDGHQEIDESEIPKTKTNNFIRPNPKKFSHFDFADGSDPQDAPKPGVPFDERPKSKHDSQWDFGDFVTPQKVKPSRTMRTQDVRHWDTDKDAMGETPVQPHVKPRPDADAHFELQDDGEPIPHQQRPGAKPKGAIHNEGLGLYKNQLFDKVDPVPGADRALGNITNIKDRGKDFDPHFDITDDSPAPHRSQPVPEGRMKAVKMMNPNWSSYEQSPPAQKENRPKDPTEGTKGGIHIAGDGMGGRKGTNRDWLYGDGQDDFQSVPGRKPNAAAASAAGTGPKSGQIHIAGDGMGGKKGTERDWLYDETTQASKPMPGRTPNAAAASAAGTGPQTEKIRIAGDGMGGKKGTERDWLYSETTEAPKPVSGRTPNVAAASATGTGPKTEKIHIAGDGMGGKKGTERDWLYSETTEAPRPVSGRTPNVAAASAAGTGPKTERIHIAGDGMGGKKGTERDWLYSETTEAPKPVSGRTPNVAAASAAGTGPKTEKIRIAGDGMGGKKGTERDWLYTEHNENTRPGNAANAANAGKKDFWDF